MKTGFVQSNFMCKIPGFDMIPVQVRITKKLVEMLDELIENGVYSNRSEAIRDAIRKNITHFHGNGLLKRVEQKPVL